MSEDTINDKLSEQGLLNAVNEAISQLQAACSQFSDVMLALTNHEADGEAHPDIRDLISDVVNGTGFLLKTEANPLITEFITNHNSDAGAHPSILNLINTVNAQVATLKSRLDVLAPEDPTDPASELAQRLAEIDNQFDPVLAALREAWLSATIGNTGTADSIAADYTATAAAKAAAIAEVMEEFEYVS